MRPPAHARRPLRSALVALALLLAVAAGVIGMWRPWAPVSPSTASAADAAGPAAAPAPSPLVLPEHPRVLVFGDSWTYGSAASDPALGYAYQIGGLLGGESVVNGVRGSGYLKPGLDGPAYGERIAALDPSISPDLVVIQGSINDRTLVGDAGYARAVTAAWDAMAATYPGAQIVILGPAPHELPVGSGTARIDRELGDLAAARGWWYISPVAQDWITPENYLDVIDVDLGRRHPSTAGHRYLAERLASALEELRGAPVTEAGSKSSPKQ